MSGRLSARATRGSSLMVRAHGSSEPETRREEELMRFHHDDEQQSIRPQPPCARRVKKEKVMIVRGAKSCIARLMKAEIELPEQPKSPWFFTVIGQDSAREDTG